MTNGNRPFSEPAGLLGPVALSGCLALLALAPLMRGGNRHPALIALELLGLVILVGLSLRALRPDSIPARMRWPIGVLVLSPLLLAAFQLTPLPAWLWLRLPGHDIYAQTLDGAGAAMSGWLPLSVDAGATAASLLAGIPLAATFLAGHYASLPQLRLVLRTVIAMALVQVVLGVLQFAGGADSALYFGLPGGRPVGTFANSNHYGNYLAMCLIALIWLSYESGKRAVSAHSHALLSPRNRLIVAATGALFLVLGLLMSLSRGAAVSGLACAAAAMAIVGLRLRGPRTGARLAAAAALLLLLVLAAVALLGADTATSRASAGTLADSAGYRARLAATSLDGALAFMPWGAGWGTYDQAYQRFQPAEIAGFANHAHMDYVELLLEGGLPFLLLAGLFTWLAASRIVELVRHARQGGALHSEAMACVLCGLGLLTLLAHSLVEFNMRIPANAILAALLAGVFLRPLALAGPAEPR